MSRTSDGSRGHVALTRSVLLTVAALAAGLGAGCGATLAEGQGPEVVRQARPTTTPIRSSPTDWPNAQTTGAKGQLTPVATRTLRDDGAVLQNAQVDGQLVVAADDVTIRNVHVKTDGYFGILVAGKNVRIEDTTIEGFAGTEAGLAAYPGGQFIAHRINVFKFEDGVHVNSHSELYDSYVHDLVGDQAAHFDGVTANNEIDWKIVHNTILNQHDQTAAVWVGDPRDVPSQGLLEDNYLAGGGYTIYGGPGTSTGIQVVGNTFSTRYFPKSGYFGIVAAWVPGGNVWSGNTWADGPHVGEPVLPQ